jgi:formylmethanofuran dehydrogenase subunit D
MTFIMNTGRTIEQGSFVERKGSREYRQETSTVRMNPVDMMEIGVEDGGNVCVSSSSGMVVLTALGSDDQQQGQVFVPLGPYANHLVPGETHGTGMPDFKTTLVEIIPTSQEVLPVWKLMECCGGLRYEDH